MKEQLLKSAAALNQPLKSAAQEFSSKRDALAAKGNQVIACYWAANFNVWVDMLRQELSEDAFDALYPYYNWLIVNIPIFVKMTDIDLSAHEADNVPSH